jgi:carbamoyltransferase
MKGTEAYIGLNKGHDGGVCLLPVHESPLGMELLLKERFTRVKHAGGELNQLLFKVVDKVVVVPERIAETSFRGAEQMWNAREPYFEILRRCGLGAYTIQFNPKLRLFTHHYAHARAAATLSPFSNSLIIVFDGSGNCRSDFAAGHPEITCFPPPSVPGTPLESCTVYRQTGSRLECVLKEWQFFDNMTGHKGLGWLFTLAAVHIFNDRWAEGKVMGLAALGRPDVYTVRTREELFGKLGDGNAFRGRGKRPWEECGRVQYYADIARAVQEHFERSLFELAEKLKQRFPDEENLILTGGCALNCIANMKLVDKGLFKSFYVPPFPGDDSVALGSACALRYENESEPWSPCPWEDQIPNFGPRESAPSAAACRDIFKGWTLRELSDPAAEAARLLSRGKIVAWFQGRSESGPRALGFRSILADPGRPEIQDYLNERVKGREKFRPYGCSVLWEDAATYFEIPRGFESPFMSFAPRVRGPWRERLGGIAHADGTSRIQTVRKSQNPLLHRCLEEMRRVRGIGCVLNTSLNVMGEPIVETLADLRRFLEKTPMDAAVAGNILIENFREARVARSVESATESTVSTKAT